MLMSRTPFRISFSGGGTDFEEYYLKEGAMIFSTSIDKYLYVTVNKKFDGKIHVRYSDTEEVSSVQDLKHNIIKEALKLLDIKKGIEIVTISDIPAKGSGLGSSSALTVGILKALHAYVGKKISNIELARMACVLEIDILKHPIGRQDQYATAIGGFHRIIFDKDGEIFLSSYDNKMVNRLERSSLLFYLGTGRNSNDILQKHKDNITTGKKVFLDMIQQMSYSFKDWIEGDTKGCTDINTILNESWVCKKAMSEMVLDKEISNKFDLLKRFNNKVGAKICGAGKTGFLLVCAEKSMHPTIRETLSDLHELPFRFSKEGSCIIYDE